MKHNKMSTARDQKLATSKASSSQLAPPPCPNPAPRISYLEYHRRQREKLTDEYKVELRHEFLTRKMDEKDRPYLFFRRKMEILNELQDKVADKPLSEHEIIDIVWFQFTKQVQDYFTTKYFTNRNGLADALFDLALEKYKRKPPISRPPRSDSSEEEKIITLPAYCIVTDVRTQEKDEISSQPDIKLPQVIRKVSTPPGRWNVHWPFKKFPEAPVIPDEVIDVSAIFPVQLEIPEPEAEVIQILECKPTIIAEMAAQCQTSTESTMYPPENLQNREAETTGSGTPEENIDCDYDMAVLLNIQDSTTSTAETTETHSGKVIIREEEHKENFSVVEGTNITESKGSPVYAKRSAKVQKRRTHWVSLKKRKYHAESITEPVKNVILPSDKTSFGVLCIDSSRGKNAAVVFLPAGKPPPPHRQRVPAPLHTSSLFRRRYHGKTKPPKLHPDHHNESFPVVPGYHPLHWIKTDNIPPHNMRRFPYSTGRPPGRLYRWLLPTSVPLQ